ncbi:MAG: FkbM family methyltransferase [Abditibacteriaceae bacterium]
METIPKIEPLQIETPVVIYGAGNSGRKAQQILQESGYSVLGFLDQNSKSTFIEELPCVLPSSECASKWCDLNATVIIAVMNPQGDSKEIDQSLSHFSWNRVIPFPQFVELFHDQWGNHFWITHRDYYKDANVRKALLETASLWKDQASRDCFEAVLYSRLCGDLAVLDTYVRKNQQPQYFPNDIPNWPTPTNFVDCGAYDGDTLREIPLQTLQSVAAFEPDMENFHALVSSTHASIQLKENDVKVLLWPCGVWNESTTLSFNAEQTSSSHVDESGANTIQVVALDHVLQGFHPDFIKMDIEGAEMNALKGAHSLIETYRPALAICVYHKPEDLWDVLQLIDSWQYGYEFYLRAHQFSGLDVVLYAKVKN